MMSSIPAYNEYAKRVLMPRWIRKFLAEIQALERRADRGAALHMELLGPSFYSQHSARGRAVRKSRHRIR